MYAGHVVETGPSKTVLADPKHPYTQLLLSAVPIPRAPLNDQADARVSPRRSSTPRLVAAFVGVARW